MGTKTFIIQIGMSIENEVNNYEFQLIVPKELSKQDVIQTIRDEHDMVKEDYEIQGKNPMVLLNHICKKYSWEWNYYNFDIQMTLQN